MDLAKFKENLDKYAQLIVEVGINVQQSHTVVLQISVEQAPLARLITKKAYELKAAEVIVEWSDETIQKEFLTHASIDRIENFPQYKIDQANEWVKKGASRISVVSSDPGSLAGVDSKRVAAYQKAAGKALINLRKATQSNQVSWTVVAAAGESWAQKVFPELSAEQAVKALWEEIFKTARVDRKDPIAAWKQHDEALEEKADELNDQQFDALHYEAPGTDLTIGLPKNHLWEGAGSFNARGEKFIANMPTEEVFTAPDSRRVDGFISSTKPLSYAGSIISGMKFTFENGKVVDFSAEKGQDVLEELLATDEGAKHLGEVALVPDPSPISQSGIIFFNTLFDENASNHLALGSAYAFNLQDGTTMSDQELKDHGLNLSQTHVDFMVGSDQMSIDGIKKDGTVVPVFRNGDWA
ncbi:aminopeptidase [Tetragenococcus koreensis]|uniref:Aminopeptidase PepS n=1 Tax=Tetragenococcus koreensis TaxID=290335 RepID=A0AAN4ZNS9_9ENTE|nr:aminopeptidase [Tetragenococcus koreensis]AYW44540.1 aminopeptidase [Tetragenococcus koreensis]MCF1584217.1 aminopeptidase [Tetragenococcus koreensis]MCF1613849.1 aminopeptidase [Tetragenococcus koreensis]MCF1616578.1 aminopeptidase [Tetragenococcus koreensis]MCF1619559.1 aminopeptidase [Tetragenococcus koreensis]